MHISQAFLSEVFEGTYLWNEAFIATANTNSTSDDEI